MDNMEDRINEKIDAMSVPDFAKLIEEVIDSGQTSIGYNSNHSSPTLIQSRLLVIRTRVLLIFLGI